MRRFAVSCRAMRRWTSCFPTAFRLHSFIVETLVKFRYRALPRRDKGSIRAYLMKMTGKSESQVTRLIRQYRDTGRIRDRRGAVDHAFRRRYTKADIGLLAKGRRGAGPTVRARHARGDAADARGVRRRALRASGRHLERPVLQPAQLHDLPAPPHHVHEDTGHCGFDRRAPQAQAEGATGLPARRHGASGGQGRREGRVPRQPRGRGDAMGARGDGARHLGALPRARAEGAHRGLSLQGTGLPRRQRLGVHQPQGGRDAERAPRPGVHQVAPPTQQ